MKHFILMTLITTTLTTNALYAMDTHPNDPTVKNTFESAKAQHRLMLLNKAHPSTLQVTCGGKLCQYTVEDKAELKTAFFSCLDNIPMVNATPDNVATPTVISIDITALKNYLLFKPIKTEDDAQAGKELKKPSKASQPAFSIDEKLALLKTADPDKIFIRSLPTSKRESRIAIAQRLVTLVDAISIEKNGVITIDGPLVEAFVNNSDLTPVVDPYELETTQSLELLKTKGDVPAHQTNPIQPTALARLTHPVNLVALAIVGAVCWHASKHVNSHDV